MSLLIFLFAAFIGAEQPLMELPDPEAPLPALTDSMKQKRLNLGKRTGPAAVVSEIFFGAAEFGKPFSYESIDRAVAKGGIQINLSFTWVAGREFVGSDKTIHQLSERAKEYKHFSEVFLEYRAEPWKAGLTQGEPILARDIVELAVTRGVYVYLYGVTALRDLWKDNENKSQLPIEGIKPPFDIHRLTRFWGHVRNGDLEFKDVPSFAGLEIDEGFVVVADPRMRAVPLLKQKWISNVGEDRVAREQPAKKLLPRRAWADLESNCKRELEGKSPIQLLSLAAVQYPSSFIDLAVRHWESIDRHELAHVLRLIFWVTELRPDLKTKPLLTKVSEMIKDENELAKHYARLITIRPDQPAITPLDDLKKMHKKLSNLSTEKSSEYYRPFVVCCQEVSRASNFEEVYSEFFRQLLKNELDREKDRCCIEVDQDIALFLLSLIREGKLKSATTILSQPWVTSNELMRTLASLGGEESLKSLEGLMNGIYPPDVALSLEQLKEAARNDCIGGGVYWKNLSRQESAARALTYFRTDDKPAILAKLLVHSNYLVRWQGILGCWRYPDPRYRQLLEHSFPWAVDVWDAEHSKK